MAGRRRNTSSPIARKIRNLKTNKKDVSRPLKIKEKAGKKTSECKFDCSHHSKCKKKVGCDCKGSIQLDNSTKSDMYGTGVTPKSFVSTILYALNLNKIPQNKKLTKDFFIDNLTTSYNFQNEKPCQVSCNCRKPPETASIKTQASIVLPSSRIPEQNTVVFQNTGIDPIKVYNAEVRKFKGEQKYSTYNCQIITDEMDCKCSPPKPTPPCKTFDCDCITEIGNKIARKQHRPYCPSYKHKSNCPVMMSKEDEEKQDEDEDETAPLPYGLPPIKLGPCPIMGKPCANPDGFNRMYRTQAQPVLPDSYSEAGNVCCSKEYNRIKKCLKDYLRYEKDHDYRCINKFNVDTETRCCDKEQRLLSLMGKDCCGTHKLLIREKYRQDEHGGHNT